MLDTLSIIASEQSMQMIVPVDLAWLIGAFAVFGFFHIMQEFVFWCQDAKAWVKNKIR